MGTTVQVDASQVVNQLPLGTTGKRNFERLVIGLVDEVAKLRASRQLLLAKLDADTGITGTDFSSSASVAPAIVVK